MTSKLVLGFAVAILTTFLMPASEALAICCGGTCCLIDTVCRTTGEVNPDNECQTCDPSSDRRGWTDTPGCTPGGEDAGMSTPDGGPPIMEDAGTPAEEDAGPAAGDAGTSGGDAGIPPVTDGGTTDEDSGSGDGGCAAGGSGAFGGLFGLLILGLRRKKEEQ